MGFGKDGKGAILREEGVITLGTLAANASIKSASQLAIQDDFRILKTEVFVAAEGFATDEYMVMVGIADNELDVTEIAETMDLSGPLDRNDHDGSEKVMRPVWDIVQVGQDPGHEIPNNGLPIKFNLKWTFRNPEGWTFFAFNNSGSQLTTGGVIRYRAKHYGVWV